MGSIMTTLSSGDAIALGPLWAEDPIAFQTVARFRGQIAILELAIILATVLYLWLRDRALSDCQSDQPGDAKR